MPYKNVGTANYYIRYPLEYLKWRVLDVMTGAESIRVKFKRR